MLAVLLHGVSPPIVSYSYRCSALVAWYKAAAPQEEVYLKMQKAAGTNDKYSMVICYTLCLCGVIESFCYYSFLSGLFSLWGFCALFSICISYSEHHKLETCVN